MIVRENIIEIFCVLMASRCCGSAFSGCGFLSPAAGFSPAVLSVALVKAPPLHAPPASDDSLPDPEETSRNRCANLGKGEKM